MLQALITAGLWFTLTVTASPSSLVSRQTVLTDLPSGWTFNACYIDNPTSRSLNGASFVNATSMTVEACVTFCNSQSFVYAGLEFGQECYCDNVFEGTAESVDNSECSEACVGNSTELCGAGNRLSVYTSGTAAVFPTLVPSVGSWVSLGCFSDSTSARTLQTRVNAPSVTVESCTAACFSQGFTLAGVEFGQECWCGSKVLNGGAFVGNSNGITGNPPVRHPGDFCDMACAGNSNELCGGPNRLNLYNFTGSSAATILPSIPNWLSIGCFRDQTPETTLRAQITLSVGVTVETCTAGCFNQGFTLAGVEDGRQCFCDTEMVFSPKPIANSNCNIPCVANPFEICGGLLALEVYQFQNVTGVLNALATIATPANTLIALVNSVTASNVQTVGPQIAPAVVNFASTINTAVGNAVAPVNGGREPLTGDNANQIVLPLERAGSSVAAVASALASASTLLNPGFSGPILSSINTLTRAADGLAQQMAFEVSPAISTTALSEQTSMENALQQASSKY